MAAHLPAQIPLRDKAEGTEHVPEVEAGGFHADAHFPRLQGRRRERLDTRFLERAAGVRRQRPVGLFR